MALAETARLIASLELKDKGFGTGVAKAEGQLAGLNKATSKTGVLGASASKGMTTMSRAATGLGGALGKAKGAVTGFAGSLGPLLGVGGVLGIGALFASSINKAEEFGQSIRKVQAITGESAEATSAYIDALDKYGIGADKVIKLTGILEKNLGKIGSTTKTAAKFQTDYGFSVLDASGKVADATTIFFRATEFFNSNASASDKATALNKLYGKSWQDLIPAMSQGTTAIKKEFGTALQLGDAQLKNIDKFKAAQREFADEFGDLQVTIGAEILPALIGPLKEFTGFLSAHRTDIVDFIKGGVSAAKELGGALSALAPIGKTIVDAFNAIPPDIRKLLIGGVIANKALKVTFGFDPLKIIGGGIGEALKGAVGGFFGRGGPTNPMFTKEVGLGATGGVGGVAGKTGIAGKLVQAVSIVSIAAEAAAVFATWQSVNEASTKQSKEVAATAAEWFKKSPTKEELLSSLAGVQQGIADIRNNPLLMLVQGDALKYLEATASGIQTQIADIGKRAEFTGGFTGFEGKGPGFRPSDVIGNKALSQAALTQIKKLDVLHQDFLAQRALIKSGTDAQKAAAAAALAKDVTKGVGNVGTTKDLAAQLRATALTVKDPAAKAAIIASAARIEGKIQGREWIATQKAAAEKIARSNEATGQKIRELKGIQQSLIAHGDTAAARIVGALLSGVVPAINALKNGINVNLPGVLPGTSPTRPRNSNTPAVPSDPRVGIEKNRTSIVLQSAPATHRDISKVKVVRNRIGGTPADVGAI